MQENQISESEIYRANVAANALLAAMEGKTLVEAQAVVRDNFGTYQSIKAAHPVRAIHIDNLLKCIAASAAQQPTNHRKGRT